MISIGCGFGGPGLSQAAIGKLLLAASRLVEEYRGNYAEGSIPEVNVVFYIPGPVANFPPLDAPRAGRFSRKRKLLLVEVYVPRDVAEAGGSVEFVTNSLRRANAIAAEVFARKGTEPFDPARANAIVDRVSEALAATPR